MSADRHIPFETDDRLAGRLRAVVETLRALTIELERVAAILDPPADESGKR